MRKFVTKGFFGIVILLTLALLGCSDGGHGYEGSWETATVIDLGFHQEQTVETIILGKDYIENNGNRQNFEKIFGRESAGTKYLVMLQDNEEMAFKVSEGGKRLTATNGPMTITMTKK